MWIRRVEALSIHADRFVPGGPRGGGRVRQVGGTLQPHEAGHPQGEGEGEAGILNAKIVLFTRASNKGSQRFHGEGFHI